MFTIQDVRERCEQGKIKWSLHSVERILQRGISRDDIICALKTGEVIEEYPDYWMNPAALIYGKSTRNVVIHVVIGIDEFIHVVTAYYPDSSKFEVDLKTRKEK